MDQIGLFGGSFDPVHIGHLLVAQAAREELNLQRLFFVPAAQSPFKPERQTAPAAERLRLLRLALAGHTHYQVDEQELHRGGVSFTIDTVRDYVQRFEGSRIYYLIGADHGPLLHKWRCADELAQLVTFVFIPRPGESPVQLPAPFKTRQLAGFPVAISSSEVRARVKAGLPLEPLVSSSVAEAIRNNRLYL